MSKKILIGWMVAALLMMTGCGGSISAMLSNLDLDQGQEQDQDQDQDQGQDQEQDQGQEQDQDQGQDQEQDQDQGQDQDQIVQCDAVPGYAYSQLSQVEQEIYLRLLAVVTGRQQQLTDLPGEMSSAWMGEMVQAVLADHPGIFWFNGSGELTQKRSLWGKSCVFVPQYLYTGEQILRRQQQIEKNTADFLAAVDVQAGDYERALTAYEYVIQNTDYVLGAMDNQNICSVFLNGQSVCTGYAKAFQYLLQKLGIEAAYVTGQIIQTGEKHAWVL
ncbi:MAG: transglutaminase domain-containing protein, partial [Clostridiales bacterium]